ncbi:MAG TPA: Uma2 family endonuclease [Gemmataceae bacterium]|jgi:Uma2 family endonuclease
MAHVKQAKATLADLYRTPGKAELIGGRIVPHMATGYLPNRIAGRIYRSLDDYVEHLKTGAACTDNQGYAIPELPSGRESFSPDASYYAGPLPVNRMEFIQGAPTFAVEVRSENDYTRLAEAEIADKRADYFAAGTAVVWDVDPINEIIHSYRTSDPTNPLIFQRGDTAHAEPAVSGWRVAVDWIFG